MNQNNPIIEKLELERMGGPLFSGRERGILNRKKFNLDSLDEEDSIINVIIPENTYSITSSFFMGLFGDSIRKMGNRENFFRKYQFKMPDRFVNKIDIYIERALRENTALI